jgi:hypothetical protein
MGEIWSGSNDLRLHLPAQLGQIERIKMSTRGGVNSRT